MFSTLPSQLAPSAIQLPNKHRCPDEGRFRSELYCVTANKDATALQLALPLTFGTGVLHLIQINHQPYATVSQFIMLTCVYSSTYLGRFSAHHQELNDCSDSLWFYLRIVVIVVLCSWSGRPAGPTTNTALLSPSSDCKPEAATAVVVASDDGNEDA
jgi:hypothetical protein